MKNKLFEAVLLGDDAKTAIADNIQSKATIDPKQNEFLKLVYTLRATKISGYADGMKDYIIVADPASDTTITTSTNEDQYLEIIKKIVRYPDPQFLEDEFVTPYIDRPMHELFTNIARFFYDGTTLKKEPTITPDPQFKITKEEMDFIEGDTGSDAAGLQLTDEYKTLFAKYVNQKTYEGVFGPGLADINYLSSVYIKKK